MIAPTTLFELFGDFSLNWPSDQIKETVGIEANFPPPNPATWLGALNNGVDVNDIRMGAENDRVSVQAKLSIDNARTAYPDGYPFVFFHMPDVEFRVNNGDNIQLFAALFEDGAEIIIENLGVEIFLPAGLIEPPKNDDAHASTITEVKKSGAGLDVTYRSGSDRGTSIKTKIRLHITKEFEVSIRTAAPISFEACIFSGISVKAIHDFVLIPTPRLAQQKQDWLRHSIEPFIEESPVVGQFAIRSLEFDATKAPFKDIAEWMNEKSENNPKAEFVIEDLVVPFYSLYVLPIPRHITLGIRRMLEKLNDPADLFHFDEAPVRAFFSRDPAVSFIIESLFYKSLPADALDRDAGLRFSAGIVFDGAAASSSDSAPSTDSSDSSPTTANNAILLSLRENYTIAASYKRDFSSSTGLPDPGTGFAQAINTILHWEIAGITIDIMGISLGYSIGRHLELAEKGEDGKFGKSAEATIDLYVYMPPTGNDDSFFKLRSLSGEKAAFAIEGLGWKQGSLNLSGVKFPDGVVAVFGPVGIILEEIGLLAEQGATYFNISGGVLIKVPSGFEGGVVFRRLRFRISGNPDAPPFKMDGFFVYLKASTVYIEAGGYYTENQVGDKKIKEFGMTGLVAFELSAIDYKFGLDLITGSIESPSEEFKYLMFQIFFRGSVVMGGFELRGVRVLFARNMQPKLKELDKDSHELRYYSWYKSSNPINVPGDRRLAAWKAQNESWAFGLGVSASFPGTGCALEFGIFVLIVSCEDAVSFLIVGEIMLLSSPKPIAYLAIEWDGKNDRFSMIIGVDLKIDNFLENPPDWSKNIAKLTGTLFISNDPGTFAIGRLNDQRTWLTLTFDFNFILKAMISLGLCVEIVDGGPKGFGFFIRFEGGLNAGIVKVQYHLGFGFMVAVFTTASNDYAVVVWLEGGLRITLFGFLRFGISARAEFRHVGSRPSRGELRLTARLETPWFLPDVTWTWETVFGELAPAELSSTTAPLRTAGASDIRNQTFALHTERLDNSWNGEGTAPLHSINQLRAISTSASQRIARFENNTTLEAIAIDATVEMEFSVPVNDRLSLDASIPNGSGDQTSGDLDLIYDLIGIEIRRRPRYGNSRSWVSIENREELTADFTDPMGVGLSGSYNASVINKFWDPSVRVDKAPTAKKLMLNAKTPYEFQTSNPELDEEIARENRHWPCCDLKDIRKQSIQIHQLDYRDELIGANVVGPHYFTNSVSPWVFHTDTFVRQARMGTLNPPAGRVAFAYGTRPGLIAQAEFDQDVAYCLIRMAWASRLGILRVVAFNLEGDRQRIWDFNRPNSTGFEAVPIAATFPIRRVEIHYVGIQEDYHNYDDSSFENGLNFAAIASTNYQRGFAIELDCAKYVEVKSYLDTAIDWETCKDNNTNAHDAYEGKGKLSFLPNHEYEIALKTRVSIKHPSTEEESVELTEYVYFKTKGLTGLNAVNRIGEEIEPYVRANYQGGKGSLYREEPVLVHFEEDFHVAVPLAVRPSGSLDEHTTLLSMQLLTAPKVATSNATVETSTQEDWIVANRTVMITELLGARIFTPSSGFTIATNMISIDPALERLASMTQRDTVRCNLDDPRNVTGSVLVAMPEGTSDPDDPSKKLWPAATPFSAMIRPDNAGFIARSRFVTQDLTAFTFATDRAVSVLPTWGVTDGKMSANRNTGRQFALFGESTWNHLEAKFSIEINQGFAGIGFALPGIGAPNRGLFAIVKKVNDRYHLELVKRNSGTAFVVENSTTLPEEVGADGAAIAVHIVAFDDKLRLAVRESSIEIDRGDLREGRMALVSSGRAAFTTLEVHGLDMYTFPFQVSRFISFEDHIQSFGGEIDEIQADIMGSGSTTTTPSNIYTQTRTAIASSMQPDATPEERQVIFEQWVNELGLPLKDEILGLEISRFVNASGKTSFFLIESPEPLDGTEEVSVQLQVRKRLPSRPIEVLDQFQDVVFRRAPEPFIRTRVEEVNTLMEERNALRNYLFYQPESIERLGESIEEEPLPIFANLQLEEVEKHSDRLEVLLNTDDLEGKARGRKEFVFIEKLDEEGTLRFYSGQADLQNGTSFLQANRTVLPLEISSAIDKLVRPKVDGINIGDIFGVNITDSVIVAPYFPRYKYEDVDSVILQDASLKRMILIPLQGNTLRQLNSGRYKLHFEIIKKRWNTTDVVDELNTYEKTSTLKLML